MAGDQEDAEAAAQRLEDALERIARAARARSGAAVAGHPVEPDGAGRIDGAILARLDALIGELRSVLGGKPDGAA